MKTNIVSRILIIAALVCSLLLCASCGSDGQTSPNRTDNSDGIVIADDENSTVSFVGEFYNPADGENATTLSVADNGDGTYAVEIGIFRLTVQDDGVGTVNDGVLTFVATDDAGNPMTWEVTAAGDHLVATVADSTWELLANGDRIEFFPVSE